MNCVVPGLNIKIVGKALHALAKVGDELYIEARTDKLIFTSLNLRKTVCVKYYFLDSFFSSYTINEDGTRNDQNEAVTCKIHMKTLLPLFKGVHLEKKFDFVKLNYENNSDVILLKMKYKCDDIQMTHKLKLMDPAVLTIDVRPDSGCNNIVTVSSSYNQLLNMFSHSDDEITMEISKHNMVAKNYCTGAPIRPKHVRSQVNLNGSEFNIYQIGKETTVNFSLKPFRTAIQFADGLNMNIGLNFDKGGCPLTIFMKNPTFEANFIVATLNPYSDIHSSLSTGSIPAKITQLNGEQLSLSQDDRDALMNENWDDLEVEGRKRSKFMRIIQDSKRKADENSSILANKEGQNKRENDNLLAEDIERNFELSQVSLPPLAKKARVVFKRCLESTFRPDYDVIVPNSDSDSD